MNRTPGVPAGRLNWPGREDLIEGTGELGVAVAEEEVAEEEVAEEEVAKEEAE